MAVKLLNGLALFGGNPYGGYGSYGRSGGAGLWQFIVGIIVGLVLTILLYVLVFPESRKASLNGFFQFIKDFFDMKYLLIEKILKFIYVLNTMTVISVGFFLLFGRTFVSGLLMIIFGPIVQRILYEAVMLGILLVKNTIEINNKLGGSKEGSAFGGSFSMPKKPVPAPVAPAATPVQPAPQAAPTAPAQPATPVQPAAPSQPVSQPVAPAPQAPTAPAQPTAPAASAPKVCPTCGTPLEAGAIFCAACGTKVQ
jgi:hypothetical protein